MAIFGEPLGTIEERQPYKLSSQYTLDLGMVYEYEVSHVIVSTGTELQLRINQVNTLDFLTIVNSASSAVLTFEPIDEDLVGQTIVKTLESYDPITGYVYHTDVIRLIIRDRTTYNPPNFAADRLVK